MAMAAGVGILVMLGWLAAASAPVGPSAAGPSAAGPSAIGASAHGFAGSVTSLGHVDDVTETMSGVVAPVAAPTPAAPGTAPSAPVVDPPEPTSERF